MTAKGSYVIITLLKIKEAFICPERWLSWTKALAWKASRRGKTSSRGFESLSLRHIVNIELASKTKQALLYLTCQSLGRARRGGSGALNLQTAIAGLNPFLRLMFFRV